MIHAQQGCGDVEAIHSINVLRVLRVTSAHALRVVAFAFRCASVKDAHSQSIHI
jgi:hypothetical protein